MAATIGTALAAAGQPAPARAGCLTGALIGGVAGHMAGHGVLGAAGGCAIGHHRSRMRAERARDDAARTNGDGGRTNGYRDGTNQGGTEYRTPNRY